MLFFCLVRGKIAAPDMLSMLMVGTASRLMSHPAPCVGIGRARSLVASATKDYPIKPLESFQEIEWPEGFPFSDPRYFARSDESPDSEFYECAGQSRSIHH